MSSPNAPESPTTAWGHLKAALPKNWQQIVSWLAVALLSGILAKYGLGPLLPPTPAPVPVWDADAGK